MNPIQITITGRLGDDPRTFRTRDGSDGAELRIAVEIPARGNGDSVTRWVKVTAYGVLATRTAESVRKGDRVTVIADDMVAEAWTANRQRRAPRPGHPARPRHRRVDGVRQPAHRPRRPQGRPRRRRQRRAHRSPGARAGRGPGPGRSHHVLTTPRVRAGPIGPPAPACLS